MLQAVQIVISGMAQGCIYGLIALGLVLIYKTTETVSFAHGELMMLGAFAGFAPDDARRLAVLARAARDDRWRWRSFGIGLERVVIRPILGQPAFSLVMLTIGIGYVARGLVTMIPGIGTETHTLPVPYKDQTWNVGALVLNVEQMVVIAATARALRAALRDVPLQQGRHRDAGVVAEPARRLLHGHPGAAPERPGLGPGRRASPRSPACCSRRSPSSTPTWASSA